MGTSNRRKFHFTEWAKKNLLLTLASIAGCIGAVFFVLAGPVWAVGGISGAVTGYFCANVIIKIIEEAKKYWW